MNTVSKTPGKKKTNGCVLETLCAAVEGFVAVFLPGLCHASTENERGACFPSSVIFIPKVSASDTTDRGGS